MAKISEAKRDEMFAAWQEKQSLDYVAKKVGVSWPTCARYREKDNWDERTAKIKAKAVRKMDNDAAKRRVRWAQQGQALQTVGTRKFYSKEGKLDEKAVLSLSGSEAIKAIVDGIRIEREAVGEPGEVNKTIVDLNGLSIEELEERLTRLKQGELC